jgi:hypothetical protein
VNDRANNKITIVIVIFINVYIEIFYTYLRHTINWFLAFLSRIKITYFMIKTPLLKVCICLTVLFSLYSCKKDTNLSPLISSAPTASHNAKIASDWMETIRQMVKLESKNPPQASRIYGYNSITLYESVVNGIPGNQSLAGKIFGYSTAAKAPINAVDYATVLNEALYSVNKSLFGSTINIINSNRLDSIHTINLTERKLQVDESVINNSIAFGNEVATTINSSLNSDNFSTTRTMVYTVPSRLQNPMFWAPTDAVNLQPAEPFWGTLRCFSMPSAYMCEVPSIVHFDSATNSDFFRMALEVYTVNQQLTQNQKDIALWWADGAGATPTPPGHWLSIENQLATNLRLNLAQVAEMYALVGIAQADAFISCWYSKYKYNLLRPQTYINDYLPGAANWRPFLKTPAFPEYPSGHSVSSSAAAEILTSLFGTISFIDKTNEKMGYQPRFYASFYDAANEAALSRLYGGIHYREANENGIRQGKALAQYLLRTIKLK